VVTVGPELAGLAARPGLRFEAYRWLIGAFLIADFGYALAFNLLPDGPRVALAAVLFLGQTAMAVVSLGVRPDPWRLRVFFLVTAVAFCWLVAYLMLRQELHPTEILRSLGPIYFGLWIMGYYDRLPVRLTWLLAGFGCLFALAWGLSMPAYHHGAEAFQLGAAMPRFQPLHGGWQNPHSSAYLILLCVILVHLALVAGLVRGRVAWPLIGAGMAYVVGSFSTQVLVSAIVYFGVHGLLSRRVRRITKWGFGVLVVLLAVGVIFENEIRKADIRADIRFNAEELGSGRLGTWIDRVELIAARDLGTFLLGSGVGSDEMSSRTWRQKETTSHNTFLTIFIEAGAVGFAAYLSAFIVLI